MFISRDYIVKTGKVILKTIEDGFPTKTVHYGQNSSLFKKGVRTMKVTDYLDGRTMYDFYGKKGVALNEGIERVAGDKSFTQRIRDFLGELG